MFYNSLKNKATQWDTHKSNDEDGRDYKDEEDYEDGM